MEFSNDVVIKTVEMHTSGHPVRVIKNGYPEIKGDTILQKRRYAQEHTDGFRKLLIHEPRGHYDMFGALLVAPTVENADMAVLFVHSGGFSTMCGHATIALGRYAIDKGIIKTPTAPETEVKIQCPCGVVTAYTEYNAVTKKTGRTRFRSVPAFAFQLDYEVQVPGYGTVKVDIGYGGAFYALIDGSLLGINVRTASARDVTQAANSVTEAVRASIKIHHPTDDDLAFLFGTVITDGRDEFSEEPTAQTCVFGDNAQCDRSVCGSGATTRLAVQRAKGQIKPEQCRVFESGVTGCQFMGKVVEETKLGEFDAVIAEISGKGYYTGESTFTVEEDDTLKNGFLLRQ